MTQYLVQWQSKNRLGSEGIPLICGDLTRLKLELINWYQLTQDIISDWGSDTQVRILYPPKKIGNLIPGETLQVFEVINEVCPEYVLVSCINSS